MGFGLCTCKSSARGKKKGPSPRVAAKQFPSEGPQTEMEMTMESFNSETARMQAPLRAMVEVIDGKLRIFPLADSDRQAEAIVKAVVEANQR